MSSVDVSSESTTGSPPVRAGEFKLEAVVLPVSDVNRRFPASSTQTRKPRLSGVAKTATYMREDAGSNGFLTLLSDSERLTGAYALGPEAGEWLQQATLAIRAHIPLEILTDTIQPFPTFSEIYVAALKKLHDEIDRHGIGAVDPPP
jgi:hypothetical protein